ASGHGMRVVSHSRGNPETEVDRSLNTAACSPTLLPNDSWAVGVPDPLQDHRVVPPGAARPFTLAGSHVASLPPLAATTSRAPAQLPPLRWPALGSDAAAKSPQPGSFPSWQMCCQYRLAARPRKGSTQRVGPSVDARVRSGRGRTCPVRRTSAGRAGKYKEIA